MAMTRKEQSQLIDALKTHNYSAAKKLVRGSCEWVVFIIIRNVALKRSHFEKDHKRYSKYKMVGELTGTAAREVRRGRTLNPVKYIDLLAKVRKG